MENIEKSKSFDSLFTILEFLFSNRDPNLIEDNRKILWQIFNGTINNYRVIDHLIDRANKYLPDYTEIHTKYKESDDNK